MMVNSAVNNDISDLADTRLTSQTLCENEYRKE